MTYIVKALQLAPGATSQQTCHGCFSMSASVLHPSSVSLRGPVREIPKPRFWRDDTKARTGLLPGSRHSQSGLDPACTKQSVIRLSLPADTSQQRGREARGSGSTSCGNPVRLAGERNLAPSFRRVRVRVWPFLFEGGAIPKACSPD